MREKGCQTGLKNNNWRGGKSLYCCDQCGKSFLVYTSSCIPGGKKFCSKECGYENKRRRTIIVCEYCGKDFQRNINDIERRSGKQFCSHKCSGEYYSGKQCPSWKHGMSPELVKIRQRKDYQLWRKAVLKRDGFMCIKCGEKGNHAHHILSFTYYPEERYAVDNGVTWCPGCHFKWHGLGPRNALGQYVACDLQENQLGL